LDSGCDPDEAGARDSFAGKLMGYAATGKWKPSIGITVHDILHRKALESYSFDAVPPSLLYMLCESVQIQQDVAASIQAEF